MSYLQIRINYNSRGNAALLYRELIAPLQRSWAQHYFHSWTIAKAWQNGRHVLLTLDCDDPFFDDKLQEKAATCIGDFLARHPSPSYDIDAHIATQSRLAELEGADIDPSWVAPNNTYETTQQELARLSRKYERPAQWQSIFDTDVRLRPVIIRHILGGQDDVRFVCELLTLLACVYPPVASDDPQFHQYNGFLSFYSHYHLWHHRLPDAQRDAVDQSFTAWFERDREGLLLWWTGLEEGLAREGSGACELSSLLLAAFLGFARMADQGLIHERSPYPHERLAPPDSVPDFHRQFFYSQSGAPRKFGRTFAAYRWLLNIIYRTLPLLDVSPLRRHYLNFSLFELQRQQPDLIERLRVGMLRTL